MEKAIGASYPLPVHLHFCPGGVTYQGAAEKAEDDATTATAQHVYHLNQYAASTTQQQQLLLRSSPTTAAAAARNKKSPQTLIHAAKRADDRLRQYSLLTATAAHDDAATTTSPAALVPHRLPSLACLASAVFDRLTGVQGVAVTKQWADAMVLSYADTGIATTTKLLPIMEAIPASEDDILNTKQAAAAEVLSDTTAPALLKRLLDQATDAAVHDISSPQFKPRPCGYVFQRGDIAWNCRTCQADATCVVCDNCFRNSDHQGHEVYFHRTTPGGCCDCGDAEAWKSQGCCDQHRPQAVTDPRKEYAPDDPMEAVGMAARGRLEGMESLSQEPTALPPRLAAALGVVIGAAVGCMVQAADGAGAGSDPVQWKMRWADEAARVWNGACCNEDYSYRRAAAIATPGTFAAGNDSEAQQELPVGLTLNLRLHNDDVHTFDEVIDALHEPRMLRRNLTEEPVNQSLVILREDATEMTHRVDTDGQVHVKEYKTIVAAMQGYRRLKSRGLHCAVVSSAQLQLEHRARALAAWLAEISAAHPAAAALVVHALVQVGHDHDLAGVGVWHEARMIPPWAAMDKADDVEACRKRFAAFPPHLETSYVTREEAELLHGIGLTVNAAAFVELTGAPPNFYSKVPYRLPSGRYHKSPHSLWGTLPSLYSDPLPPTSKHPLLQQLLTGQFDASIKNSLTEAVYLVDTDLRKQQEADRITSSVFSHRLPGLNMISGIGTIKLKDVDARRPPLASSMDLRHLLSTSSFRAPISPILLLLLLDPYPTKQVRSSIHALFLSLLTDLRFKCRFAAALAIAYRPLSTLYCAGVGTDADTPLQFTVQIFTAGSLARAMGSAPAAEKLLSSDREDGEEEHRENSIGVFTSPIAHTIVRCIHTNLLGATKEVNMILNNTSSGNDDDSQDDSSQQRNDSLLPALTYVAGEHPLMTALPAAPDDGFLDSRSTRHKRLPHLLRDLEYVIETPGTAIRLLLPQRFPPYQGPSLSFRGEDALVFSAVFCRMLRLAQGMDPQKRKISGGHVEYEQNRWLEAFGLSLHFAGTRDALAESPMSSTTSLTQVSEDGSHLVGVREAVGNTVASILREMKLWLYREGLLETGLPVPSGGGHGAMDMAQVESLQRSTLHVSGGSTPGSGSANTVALSCATGVKMTEAQLGLIESAFLNSDGSQRLNSSGVTPGSSNGAIMGDWLRVPHSPLAGDSLSFHLPLHRALAKCVQSICSVLVPESVRSANPGGWWKIPVLDEELNGSWADLTSNSQHPLVPLIRSTLRSSNCRVVWTGGPDCTPQDAQRRRSRSRNVSANIAVAKVIHSLADHPIRCIAAAQQIERHLWARNGSSVAGMAMNYSSTPLCRSFRDLDLLLVQLSAAGMTVGLGARRVFSLLLSRFSMDGYLCDPERRTQPNGPSPTNSYGTAANIWVNPPRLQEADHAIILSESFFSTVCVLVSELPPPPPGSSGDDSSLKQNIRRELLHALAAEPRSHSEAMTAASCGITRREETEGSSGANASGGLFREAFAEVLQEIGKQKNQGSSRASSGPPAFELNPEYCDEYDPTFFHLRRQEHQHAMDVIASMRKRKWGINNELSDAYCLPLVCAPPKAHPRFLPCRLLLHLQFMDAAIRRSLLFALTGGSWLPPPEPVQKAEASLDDIAVSSEAADMVGISTTTTSTSASGDVPVTTFHRGLLRHGQSSPSGSFLKRSGSESGPTPAFSKEVVAASSVSFLEVLQLLTLQVHTLEECASLHRTLPGLDEEAKALSSGLSINSYLGRLARVPDSLVDVWALQAYPAGPLQSKGSGEKRGSILGFLIALYEHRDDHGTILDAEGAEYGQADDGHGGARTLASSGLKWILRFVNALVDGAPSVGAAIKSATTGVPFRFPASSSPLGGDAGSSAWTIDENVRSIIKLMLTDVPDLWPKKREKSAAPESANSKSKEARRAAQMRVMENMKRKQAAFAATIAPTDEASGSKEDADSEDDLCIICRCDDADGDNNGPLGYLGHVQRSRVAQMRAITESSELESSSTLFHTFRVVGHMGCQVSFNNSVDTICDTVDSFLKSSNLCVSFSQLRETEAMDSSPLKCLPRGTVVTVRESKISTNYDILSRRVLVRHVANDLDTGAEVLTEGWASIQSSQGYVILSPLVSLCYSSSRWGSTRPIIRQCGHAAHLKCVETHTLSLHQRAAGEQPYDGRFAANIADGEFLCPLCKQLSNILIPRDSYAGRQPSVPLEETATPNGAIAPSESVQRTPRQLLTGARLTKSRLNDLNDFGRSALEDFGSHLHQAMCVPWERTSGSRKKQLKDWHPAIQQWDFEDDGDEEEEGVSQAPAIKNVMRLLRQQLIGWAAVGHSAAAAEAASRGVQEVLPFGVLSQTSDPWSEYIAKSRDTHPMLLDLKRTLTGTAGLLEVVCLEMANLLAKREEKAGETSVVGACLADIMAGKTWFLSVHSPQASASAEAIALWSELAALTASMPCHVSRDGELSHRSQARAVAAGMWTVEGLGSTQTTKGEPPAPMAINQLFSAIPSNIPAIPSNWGTMSPFVSDQDASDSNSLSVPFRPGIASGFLYTPLLAWDLNTLGGAVFSSLLLNDVKSLPSADELLHVAHLLLAGRIVQAVITPGGVVIPDVMELDEEDCWSEEEIQTEGPALVKLVAHCHNMVKTQSLQMATAATGEAGDLFGLTLLAGVGRAILPFARALVLMLRACSAAIRERQQKMGIHTSEPTVSEKCLDSALCRSDIMEYEDGFQILRALQGPSPSAFVDTSRDWWVLINRWLIGAIGLEAHHGSSGRSILSDIMPSLLDVTKTPSTDKEQGNISVARSIVSRPIEKSLDGVAATAAADNDSLTNVSAMDVDSPRNGHQNNFFAQPENDAFDHDVEESDGELIDDMEVDESEMIGIAEQMLGAAGGGFIASQNGSNNDDPGESSEESYSDGDDRDSDREFAHVSQCPIIPFQPSLLAVKGVGPGIKGSMFEFSTASAVMSDMSHLGLIHRKDIPTFSLIRLPKSFVELYNIVNKIKGHEDASTLDEADDGGSSETAICLLTGAVMRSGSSRRAFSRATRPPGACTLHARKNGSGIGIFFLVQKCTVLLMHNNKSAYSPSLYVDEHGEEDPGLRRGRPLFLNDARYRSLELLWRQQLIPREVAQIRSTSDRVIRDNWY